MDKSDTQLDDFIQSCFDIGLDYSARSRGAERPKVESIGTAKRGRAPGKVAARAAPEEKPGGPAAVGNPQGVVATAEERRHARDLLSQIGKTFANNRKQSKSKAFETYQHDLANNSGILVMGGAVTLKELTVLLMDLEAYMKTSVKEGETAAVRLQKFLSGELADEVD
jgi:hypothetical protein